MKRKPKISLVLASGGLKAISCIPLFEFLKEHAIDIHDIYGCSGGALFGCGYSMGVSPEEMFAVARKTWNKESFKPDIRSILSFISTPFVEKKIDSAFLKGAPIKKIIRDRCDGLRLENLSPRVYAQVTNFATGEGVLLSEGLMSEVIYASCAAFPFFPPIKIGNDWFVDGAFSAPLPLLAAVKNNADIIIAMMYDSEDSAISNNFYDNYSTLINNVHLHLRSNQISTGINMYNHEIIFIRVLFDGSISLWDIDRMDEILAISKKTVTEHGKEILAVIDHWEQSHNSSQH